jgi:DNA-binding transcriptional regulator YiaG
MLPGNLILQYRMRTGLTQAQLAALIGLKNERMLRHWETNSLLPDDRY